VTPEPQPVPGVVPPQNLEAEESVLGAMMLSPKAIEAIRGELDHPDFYRRSHGRIYIAALALHDAGEPVDAITLTDALDKTPAPPGSQHKTMLEDVGGRVRLHELAALVTATANAAHYARIIRDLARRRRIITAAMLLQQAAYDGADIDELLHQTRRIADDQPTDGAAPLAGRPHHEVLDLTFAGEAHLVDNLVEAGVVGVIAGVPETGKSWVAQAIAVGVAQGRGEILGREVKRQGNVGYIWQDDSERNEAARIQTYARVHETPRDLPITWYLNIGLQLPRDIGRLRATIQQQQLQLVVIDSFYNVITSDLKDREPGDVIALMKREICDAIGTTIIIVDHMPWATEQNRTRLRTYGDVFKAAAARFGIYIDADGSKLYVEARGNNIQGFKKTPAYWDADLLEIHLADTSKDEVDEEQLDADVLKWLYEHGGQHSTTDVRAAVPKRGQDVDNSLARLLEKGLILDQERDGARWLGRPRTARYWIHRNHAAQQSSHLFGTTPDDPDDSRPDSHRDGQVVPVVPPPVGGDDVTGRLPGPSAAADEDDEDPPLPSPPTSTGGDPCSTTPRPPIRRPRKEPVARSRPTPAYDRARRQTSRPTCRGSW
jgi:archaellum biogenesis ATPase FlaH